jgi:hypothetical protein
LYIVQGPFSVAPCQTLALRFATVASLYGGPAVKMVTRWLKRRWAVPCPTRTQHCPRRASWPTPGPAPSDWWCTDSWRRWRRRWTSSPWLRKINNPLKSAQYNPARRTRRAARGQVRTIGDQHALAEQLRTGWGTVSFNASCGREAIARGCANTHTAALQQQPPRRPKSHIPESTL